MTDPTTRAALVAEIEADRAEGTPGPFEILQPVLWIMAEDGQMQVADIRGWGRLTAPPPGGRGLSNEDARAIQEANARRIARVPEMEAQIIADAAYIAELEAALAFYADKTGDGYDAMATNYGLSMEYGIIIRDGGAIARRALAKEKADE